MAELLNKLEAGEDYKDTLNFWFRDRETGEVTRNCQRPLVQGWRSRPSICG